MAIIANAYAINIGYSDIALAVHAGDHAIYPDCREEFLIALQDLFNVNNYEKINVYAPYFDISKADILKRGLELGVDYRNTWSCYNGEEKPCGKCGTCTERTLAFVENNAQDPLYEHPEDWFKAVEYAKEQE
jgi:7-cyano-7-deazaguanine synthase